MRDQQWTSLIEAIRGQGVRAVDLLRPPRPQAEVRSALRSLGLDEDPDVLTWFSWHDGVEQEGPFIAFFTPRWDLLGLEAAVAETRSHREMDATNDEFELPRRFSPTWLSITRGIDGRHVVAHCGPMADDDPHRVREFDPADPADAIEGSTRDLGELAELWRSGIESGGYLGDGCGGWSQDFARLSPLDRAL